MITRTEIGFTDRPRDIQNSKQLIILPITYRILYFGLGIVFVSNIRVQTKVSNQITTISINGIVMSNQRCVPFNDV